MVLRPKRGRVGSRRPEPHSDEWGFFYKQVFFCLQFFLYLCKMKRERDENLMLVAAVEQYAQKHRIPTAVSFAIFREYGINTLIRKHYNALHTQPLEESFYFAEDIIKRIKAQTQRS